jgi:hypothetical protein
VQTDDAREAEAMEILNRHNPVNITEREASLRSSGWKGYEEERIGSDPARPAATGAPGGVGDVTGAPGTLPSDRRI